jgi:hypothetical protein
MTTIKNIKPVTAEQIFDLLKKKFAEYVNSKLDSNLTIEYAHVYDLIDVSFPEVIEGYAFTITVSENEIVIIKNEQDTKYDATLLEKHLVDFLIEKCE